MPIADFKIVMNDSMKKTASTKNYCNAGFFANYSENGMAFTLPVAHLVCDYNATSVSTKKYCNERGKFSGNKFTFDSSTWSYCNSFNNKYISTLLVGNNKAEIKNIKSIPSGYNYAISGIPIMLDSFSVSFANDVQTQGWDSSPLYATWHIFIGLKKEADVIYVMGMQTTTYNLVKTNEAYNKFKVLGMYNVIKLDGGGSFHMNVDGKAVATVTGDRRINTIITFNETNNTKTNNTSNNTNTNTTASTSTSSTTANKTTTVTATSTSTSTTNNITKTTAKKNNNVSTVVNTDSKTLISNTVKNAVKSKYSLLASLIRKTKT